MVNNLKAERLGQPKWPKVLIVCPASLRLNWKKEIMRWHSKDLHTPPAETIYTIVSYNNIQDPYNVSRLVEQKPDIIVADEAHALMNWSSITTKNFIFELVGKVKPKRLWLLTATPASTGAHQYHPMFSLLQPGKWGKYADFGKKYCEQRLPNGEFKGFKNMIEFKREIKGIVLKRLKKDVAPELPEISYVTKYIETLPIALPRDEHQQYNFEAIVDNFEATGELPDNLAKIMRLIGESKCYAVMDTYDEIIANYPKAPVVILTWHRNVTMLLSAMFLDRGIQHGVVIGGVKEKLKFKAIDDFQEGRTNLIICNMKAGGVGINLQRATDAIFAEQTWSPIMRQQASDRIHRIGSPNKKVTYWDLISQTMDLDQIINSVVKARIRVTSQVI